jgi:hypothetical protein
MEEIMMELREQAIQRRANELFRSVESNLVALRSMLLVVHAAMHRLQEQYRKEMHGFRLILYLKTRADNEDLLALYWAVLSRPPQELFNLMGERKVRFKNHLKGGLKKCQIYKHSEASRKERLMDYNRRAMLLNEAHQRLAAALQSAEKKWTSRGERRRWECQDLDLEAPVLSPELEARHESLMGGAWRYFLRMAATTVDLEVLCASYQAAPIHKDLSLKFTPDEAHPHGRARWLWNGHPLARLKRWGIQDRLTDAWMRSMQPRLQLTAEERRHLTEVELLRRRLMRDLRSYAAPLGDFLTRTGEALSTAQSKLAAAEGRSVEVA